jgi:hypothetical protein
VDFDRARRRRGCGKDGLVVVACRGLFLTAYHRRKRTARLKMIHLVFQLRITLLELLHGVLKILKPVVFGGVSSVLRSEGKVKETE